MVLSVAGLIGCASVGSPGGGLFDERPPELRTSDPQEGATGVTKQKLTLRFNENVKLDNAMDKLVVSPPQEKSPSILSNAKTVTIELFDSLKANTTYTIDLGDAVQDNNESNPMENLTLTFSTGDHIDTLKISGTLLNASNLEPITGAYVGIYKVYDDGRLVQGDSLHGVDSIVALYPDSIFMLKPFERAGKTDSNGRFRISGVASGRYRIYALADGNTNYRYDLFTEDVAFLDTLIEPYTEPCILYDTIYSKRDMFSLERAIAQERSSDDKNKDNEQVLDSLPIDTIIARNGFRYLPDDICLLAFNEGRVNRYLDEREWKDSLHITFRFSAMMPEPPIISLLNEESKGLAAIDKNSWLICEPNPTNDTLTYWIRDPEIYHRDTLHLEVTYPFTVDGVDVIVTDTIALSNPVPKDTDVKVKKKEKNAKSKEVESQSEVLADSVVTKVDSLSAALAVADSLSASLIVADSLSASLAVVDSLSASLAMADSLSSIVSQPDTLTPAALLSDTLSVIPLAADSLSVASTQEEAMAEEAVTEEADEDDKADKKDKKKKDKKKKKKKNEEAPADTVPKTVFMTLSLLGKNSIDIGARPRFEASAPLDTLQLSMLHLEQKNDSLWLPLEFKLEQDTLLLRRYTLHAIPHFSPGGEYRFVADSASMRDIYGHDIDSTCITFSEKKVDDYAHLVFNITGVEGPAFVQLLNEKDLPVQQAPVKDGQAKFVNVPAAKYYARLVEDSNDNGKFDPGSVLEHRQPERVYYFDALMELRAWQYSQSWDIHAKPTSRQKPKELLQNKPKEKSKKKNKNLEYLRDHPDLKKAYLKSL